ncbi:carboxypeptidase-like regulatory domain-containing protein [Plebeiibacterium sediminum]|uniref:Carboxypeptidase-like regulatory domain-containing protein n=1 Tax=Plebeiibacterium sediminum TaxID=2992112 RepID=A0AAE3M5T5_9BACT|nr:carboxypeptidase-like regulatory domain-containing protein [Plebeiobacterium sediminum]MCW3787389.1 carboxypeptidase-like regulatory domain-containing protein [Plebeiobacterium sediminum]
MNKILNKRLNLSLLLIFIVNGLLLAQNNEILVSGTMTDSEGEPIVGLTVLIEGTDKGTVTDIYGNYTIKAPLNSTLVFSFIGMKTQRAIVTRMGLNPVGTRQVIPYNNNEESTRFTHEKQVKTKQDSINFAKRMKKYRQYVSDSSVLNSYQRTQIVAPDVSTSKDIRKIQRYTDPNRQRDFMLGKIIVENDFSILTPGRTPQLQSTYSQGRPSFGELTYQGPETGEMFSWGPALRNLEFDGISTSNDKNGSLVLRGTGNGKAAKFYDPKHLFKNGFVRSTGITSYQTIFGVQTNVSYQNQHSSGILPNEEMTQNNLRFNVKLNNGIKINLNYAHTEEQFKNRLLQSRMLAATYLTPVSFDNANGLSTKKARSNIESIYHPDESIRSASPGNLDNPYLIAQEARDDNNLETLTYSIAYHPCWNTGSVDVSLSGELWQNTQQMFFPEAMAGLNSDHSSKRDDKFNNYFIRAILSNRLYDYKLQFKMPMNAEFYSYKQSLNFNGISQKGLNRNRQSFTANPYVQFNDDYSYIFIRAGANMYASSTSDKTYLWPSVGAFIKPFDILDDIFYWDTNYVMQEFKIRYNFGKQASEYSLYTKPGISNSLFYDVEDYNHYFEEKGMGYAEDINPEIITRHELGIEASFLNGNIYSEASFFTSNQKNSIYPIVENQQLVYKNVGEINTRGWEESLTARIFNGNFRWKTNLSLAQTKSEVHKLTEAGPIALAGFNNVHTTLIEGKAPGVISGSTFQRTANGQKIISDEGFPIKEDVLSVIGNPNPDWLIGLNSEFYTQGVEWGFTIDCVLGGDVWNGTQAALDFYGVSEYTAKHRNTNDYIFNGVRQDGSVNNQLVDFAPKEGSVYDNKWVRYGPGGVAEDYIEDASRLVLKELFVSYSFKDRVIRHLRLQNLSVTLAAHNLVTISGYNGNLGSNTLWGHSNTYGLDYFNSPQLRRFSVSLKITL